MAEKEFYDKTHHLKKRGGIWHVNFMRGGNRVRFSTRTKDIEEAMQIRDELLARESGPVYQAWEDLVNSDMRNPKSWIRKMIWNVRSRSKKFGPRAQRDHIYRIALRSNGRCELTGVKFRFENETASNAAPFRPSIDRIDSSKPYSYENCRLVIFAANAALRDWGDDVFHEMCTSYVANLIQRPDFRPSAGLSRLASSV